MAGIDSAYAQFNGLAPRAFHLIGRDHKVFTAAGGIIDVVFTVHLAQVRGIDRIVLSLYRTCYRLPMQKVCGMPDKQTRIVGEVGMGHVVIITVAEDGRIRVITREDTHLNALLPATCN